MIKWGEIGTIECWMTLLGSQEKNLASEMTFDKWDDLKKGLKLCFNDEIKWNGNNDFGQH